MQYQATCTKWNQKLTLSIQANTIDEARNILHGQGYSIMDIIELNRTDTGNVNFFFFDASMSGLIKTGKIQSDDIFKAYRKLTEDLWYTIIYIYTTEGMDEDQKKIITAKVKDGYELYRQSLWIDGWSQKQKTEKEADLVGISPQILKEIEHYTDIIDSTVEKIQNLFLKYHNTLTTEKRLELENIEMNLVQAKWLSNIWRLKNIVEQALTLIWALETQLVQGWMEGEKRKLLNETNNLLKQIGSSERLDTTSENDITKKITHFFENLQKKDAPIIEEQKKKVDTNSFVYYRNLRELNIYTANLKATNKKIFLALITFKFKDLKRLFLKKKLLIQNITIIDNRIHNRNISYTKVVKWAEYYFDILFLFFRKISDILLYTLFFYTIAYMILHVLDTFHIILLITEPRFFYYIWLIAGATLSFSFMRSPISIAVMSAIFVLEFIFITWNF